MSPGAKRWLLLLLGAAFLSAAGLWLLWMYVALMLSDSAWPRKDLAIALGVGLTLAFPGVGLLTAGLRFPLGSK